MTLTNSVYQPLAGLPLLIWLSPAFPVGGFAYSHALEWAVEAGDLPDEAALRDWLLTLVAHGAIRNDAILLATAWQAVRDQDRTALADTSDLALALAGSRERWIETSAQGDAFRIAIRATWRNEAWDLNDGAIPGPIAYPVAVAIAAASHGIDLGASLDAYLAALVTNLTSVAIRLGVIGQTGGQRIIAAALPELRELAAFAAHASTDDAGGCAFRSDIAAMRHETQTTRLFRT